MQIGPARRKFGRIFLSVFATCVFGYLTFHIGQWLFTIQTIEIVSNTVMLQIDEKRISRNLLFFPSENMRQEILADNPLLADIRFEKRFPHTLRVVPILRTPLARLISDGRTVLVSSEGIVLADGDSGMMLPTIILSLPFLRVGEDIEDARVTLALAAISTFPADIPIETMIYQEGSYFLARSPKLNIFIPQDRDISTTLATLQTLMAGFRIKGTLPAVVDLRFDKPIVKF